MNIPLTLVIRLVLYFVGMFTTRILFLDDLGWLIVSQGPISVERVHSTATNAERLQEHHTHVVLVDAGSRREEAFGTEATDLHAMRCEGSTESCSLPHPALLWTMLYHLNAFHFTRKVVGSGDVVHLNSLAHTADLTQLFHLGVQQQGYGSVVTKIF